MKLEWWVVAVLIVSIIVVGVIGGGWRALIFCAVIGAYFLASSLRALKRFSRRIEIVISILAVIAFFVAIFLTEKP